MLLIYVQLSILTEVQEPRDAKVINHASINQPAFSFEKQGK